jgi:HSP20 family protein
MDFNRVGRPVLTPRIDVLETDEELTLFADLPGVPPDGLELRLERDELVLHGRVPQAEHGAWLRREYAAGDFCRAFRVSDAIDRAGIWATLSDGVLTLHLPRRERGPRRIDVRGD